MLDIINLKHQPQHIATLAEWHHKEWSHFNPHESISQRITRMQTYLNTDFIPTTYIATDNELLGSAAIVANDMETKPELSPWLASVYVSERKRNNGIGTKLVEHIMRQAQTNDINKLYLLTPDQRLFYQRLGWGVLSEEHYHGTTVTIMQITLNNIKPDE